MGFFFGGGLIFGPGIFGGFRLLPPFDHPRLRSARSARRPLSFTFSISFCPNPKRKPVRRISKTANPFNFAKARYPFAFRGHYRRFMHRFTQ